MNINSSFQARTTKYTPRFLFGLSKGKARAEISAWFFFPFCRKSQSSPHHACLIFWVWRMCDVLTSEHTGWCNSGRRTKRSFRGAKSAQALCIRRSKRIQSMLTSFTVDHTKIGRAFAERVGLWTLWDISLWANIYEWTFHRETCYINWAI